MLLAVDVGNSHTKLAVFAAERILHVWRLSTVAGATADELAMQLADLMGHRGLPLRALDGLAVGSVVPPLAEVWTAIATQYLECPHVTAGHAATGGVRLDVERPQQVGADRIADAAAAWRLHGAPAIVVDLGTATKVDAIDRDGAYLGGAIAPGVGVASEALFGRAALLHRVPMEVPAHALGKDTAAQVQAGIAFGLAGQVDALVRRVRIEMGGADHVIATGGWSALLARVSEAVTAVDPFLTLHGLRIIYAHRMG